MELAERVKRQPPRVNKNRWTKCEEKYERRELLDASAFSTLEIEAFARWASLWKKEKMPPVTVIPWSVIARNRMNGSVRWTALKLGPVNAK
jgi:hypothetical protein